MEYKHIEYFIETSRHTSMSKAAESLYISQQALSRCIAGMEQELGVKLFERSVKGIRLTDIEQRNGRIIRQGNEFGKVGVYNYITENTFDAYLMNIIVTKQRFISQLMSGNYNSQYRLEDTIKNSEKRINNFTANIEAAKTDIAFAAEHKPQNDEFNIEIGGKVYTERKAAGEAIQKAAIKAMAEVGGDLRKPIGTFCGFELSIGKSHSSFGGAMAEIVIRRGISYTTDMDLTGDIGNTTRLENLFSNGIGKKIVGLEERAERTNADLQAALANKGKPFEHAEELAQKSARLEQLNLELEVGKVDEVIIADDESEREEHDRDKDAPDNDRDKPTPPKRGRR